MTTRYKIKIYYRTGNSFGSHEEEQYLEVGWNNLDMAKESLTRIKNHYEAVQKAGMLVYKKPKNLPDGVIYMPEYNMLGLELLSDFDKTFMFSAFWVGYFERLITAEIVFDDNDLIYKP